MYDPFYATHLYLTHEWVNPTVFGEAYKWQNNLIFRNCLVILHSAGSKVKLAPRMTSRTSPVLPNKRSSVCASTQSVTHTYAKVVFRESILLCAGPWTTALVHDWRHVPSIGRFCSEARVLPISANRWRKQINLVSFQQILDSLVKIWSMFIIFTDLNVYH